MSVWRVYGQWIVVTVMLAVVLFASAGRVGGPLWRSTGDIAAGL
jgi:hypothetical protein